MFGELFWMIKKLFNEVKYQETCIIKQMKYFPFKKFSAMNWCGYLLTRKDKVKDSTVRHEDFHLKQEITNFEEKKHIRYYISYYWEYLKGFTLLNPMSSAYYTNPYEMEAYANQDNPNYKVTKGSYKRYRIKNRRKTYKKYKDNWIAYVKQL